MKAFPTTKPLDSWGDPNAGMDLRDYFAAKAMQGLVSTTKDEEWLADETAEIAYVVADAMMKARSV
jgi:hypothetical protein